MRNSLFEFLVLILIKSYHFCQIQVLLQLLLKLFNFLIRLWALFAFWGFAHGWKRCFWGWNRDSSNLETITCWLVSGGNPIFCFLFVDACQKIIVFFHSDVWPLQLSHLFYHTKHALINSLWSLKISIFLLKQLIFISYGFFIFLDKGRNRLLLDDCFFIIVIVTVVSPTNLLFFRLHKSRAIDRRQLTMFDTNQIRIAVSNHIKIHDWKISFSL